MINKGGTDNRNTRQKSTTLDVFCSGSVFSIYFPRNEADKNRIKKILAELEKKYRQEFIIKLIPRVKRLCKHGAIWNRELFKPIEKTNPSLLEIKSSQLRLAILKIPKEVNYIIVHAINKKSDKWPKSDVECAERVAKTELQK